MKKTTISDMPTPHCDMTGMRIGKLTVLEYVRTESGAAKWKCQCDCGNITYKATGHLRSNAQSCGCTQRSELMGKRFGKLVVLERTDRKSNGAVLWRCRCDCGKECEKTTGALNAGFATSCGCSWRQPAVQVGERFGSLTAVRPTEQRSAKSVVWECLCDCGKTVLVRSTELTSSHTTSCGCAKRAIDEQRDFKNVLTYVDDTCVEFARDIAKPRADTSRDTGVRGVIMVGGKYQAQITFQKKRYYLGRFSRLEDAVKARRQAEIRVEEYVEEHYAT